MEDLIQIIAGSLGVDPSVLIALLPTLVFLFNLLYRSIPDDAVGFAGVVRNIARVLGLYMSNKVASGVSVNTVAKAVLDEAPKAIQNEIEDLVSDKYPKFNRDAAGKFVKSEEGFADFRLVGMFAVMGIALALLSGCTTLSGGKEVVCANKIAIRTAAEATIRALDQCPVTFEDLANNTMDSVAEND